jgi:PRTRC genetic system protein E
MLFKELSPLLANRGLILTIGMVKNDAIRVTITPRPKGKDEAKEVIQPFVVEGTAEELDTDLPKAIETYTTEIMTLERSLEELKTKTEAVLKEAKAEADKKIADAKKKPGAAKPAVKTATAKPELPKAPEPPSLFDAAVHEVAETQPTVQAAAEAATETPSDDSDDDPPSGTDGSDDDESEDSDESDDQSDQADLVAVAPAAVTPTSQPSMLFDENRFDEEEEVLKEAFGGAENSLIAA